jgi:hypothetical protein
MVVVWTIVDPDAVRRVERARVLRRGTLVRTLEAAASRNGFHDRQAFHSFSVQYLYRKCETPPLATKHLQ